MMNLFKVIQSLYLNTRNKLKKVKFKSFLMFFINFLKLVSINILNDHFFRVFINYELNKVKLQEETFKLLLKTIKVDKKIKQK